MELGRQIKALRQSRGVTQEGLAEALGVTAQSVSKWERDAAAPDIQLLPALSAYFGVTIDELFALDDDTRMERIQNMLWDERALDRAVAERESRFLLEKARREPDSGRPWTLLAQLENHMAQEHRDRAAEYARTALTREPGQKDAHSELVQAMGGRLADWCAASHGGLIDWYKDYVDRNPGDWGGCMWLLDQLIDDQRFDEAREYHARLARADHTFRTPLYEGLILWHEGRRTDAAAVWERMQRDFADDWCVWFCMGDAMARAGQYERAKELYRKSAAMQPAPRYTDAFESVAKICELQRDWPGAIAAVEEERAVLAEEWNTTSGETVDRLDRELVRLRTKM